MTRKKLLAIIFAVAAPVWLVGQTTNFTGGTPSQVDATKVRTSRLKFKAGSRSNWHSHTWGQLLMIEEGKARTQVRGGAVQEMGPGQPWWTAAGIEHWHGASPTTAMTHIAITGTLNGKNVEWMEKVTDEQYDGK